MLSFRLLWELTGTCTFDYLGKLRLNSHRKSRNSVHIPVTGYLSERIYFRRERLKLFLIGFLSSSKRMQQRKDTMDSVLKKQESKLRQPKATAHSYVATYGNSYIKRTGVFVVEKIWQEIEYQLELVPLKGGKKFQSTSTNQSKEDSFQNSRRVYPSFLMLRYLIYLTWIVLDHASSPQARMYARSHFTDFAVGVWRFLGGIQCYRSFSRVPNFYTKGTKYREKPLNHNNVAVLVLPWAK